MNKPVINIDDIEYRKFGKGDKFEASRGEVSRRIGAKQLGYSVIRLQPGKRAWPYHSHHNIEEMFYVIAGTGTLRHAGEEFPLREGDFICSPADPEQPHQIINTSDSELVYIALSDERSTDVMLYPDSGKFGVWHGDSSNMKDPANLMLFAHRKDTVDYWDGEAEDD